MQGVIRLAQRHNQVPRRRLLGLRLGAPPARHEEGRVRLATKVVTQHVERGHGVAKAAGHLLRRAPVHEIRAERLVLPLSRRLGLEEEAADVT